MPRTILLALAVALVLAHSASAASKGPGYTVLDFGKRELFPSRGLIAGPAGGSLLGLTVGAAENQLMGVVRLDRRGRPARSFGRKGMATARMGSGWMEDTTSLIRRSDG